MIAKEKILDSFKFEDHVLTKQELADVTGLSYKYVSRLVNELVYSGDLYKAGSLDTKADLFGIAVEDEIVEEDCPEKGACIF